MKEFVQNSLRTLHQGFDKSVIVLTSRKFIVLAMATYLVIEGVISDVIWATIASAFIGIQGTLDWASQRITLPGSSNKEDEDA